MQPQNHRGALVEKDLEDHLFPMPLLCAGLPPTRSVYPEPQPSIDNE